MNKTDIYFISRCILLISYRNNLNKLILSLNTSKNVEGSSSLLDDQRSFLSYYYRFESTKQVWELDDL